MYKKLDNIIKSECGKTELKKLTASGINKKRTYINGKIKQSKTIYNDWMRETGYDIFISNINEILEYNASFIVGI